MVFGLSGSSISHPVSEWSPPDQALFQPVPTQTAQVIPSPTAPVELDVIYETQIDLAEPAPTARAQVRQRVSSVKVEPKMRAPGKPNTAHGVFGVATWYCNVGPPFPSRCTSGFSASGAYAAAGPELRRALGHWRGRFVYVNGVRVQLIDWCGCGGDHVIDVYHDTWVRIPHPSNAEVTW